MADIVDAAIIGVRLRHHLPAITAHVFDALCARRTRSERAARSARVRHALSDGGAMSAIGKSAMRSSAA